MLTPWDPEQHLEMATAWAASRGVEVRDDILPRVGFVSDNAAIGWLYQTDSGLGLLETFVTNPAASVRARHRAVDEVGRALISESRKLGITRLVTMTSHKSIGRMCIRRGFGYTGPMHVLRLEV
jgi:hypothetical protein